jgi:hypothetical protein
MQKKHLAVKMAISVDPGVRAKVLRAAKEDAMSVSAWFTESARKALLLREGLKEVARWEKDNGAFLQSELAAVSAEEARLAKSSTRKRARRSA